MGDGWTSFRKELRQVGAVSTSFGLEAERFDSVGTAAGDDGRKPSGFGDDGLDTPSATPPERLLPGDGCRDLEGSNPPVKDGEPGLDPRAKPGDPGRAPPIARSKLALPGLTDLTPNPGLPGAGDVGLERTPRATPPEIGLGELGLDPGRSDGDPSGAAGEVERDGWPRFNGCGEVERDRIRPERLGDAIIPFVMGLSGDGL